MHEENNFSDAAAELKLQLMQENGVQAVGDSIADGAPCLKVYFRDNRSMRTTKIPESQHGIAIVKVVSGSIESQ